MLVLLLCALCAASLLYIYSKRTYWKAKGVPQCKGLFKRQWRTNLTLDHITTRNQWIYDQYPEAKYVGFYTLTKPYLLIKDVELIKKITVKDFDYFVDREFIIDTSSDPLWKRNLLILEGKKWKDARNLLTPSFTANKMKSMMVFVRECVQNHVDFLSKNGDSTEYEMYDILSRFTNDVIASVAFSIRINSLKDRENQFFVEGQNAVTFDLRRIAQSVLYAALPRLYKSLKLPFFPPSVLKFFRGITDEIVKKREANPHIIRQDVMHLLIEARKPVNGKKHVDLSNDDIAAHAFLYFLGGFHTVSGGLTFIFYELAVNPDVQNKLRREIEETAKRCGDELTYEDLKEMKYMEMVVKETLRIWPPVAHVTRKCNRPYVLEPALPGGKPITIDDIVMVIPILNIQRDPKHFPDPLRFDPERFSDENKANIEQCSYMAFGSGPRNCIGTRFAMIEIKMFLFHMLRVFEVEPCERTPIPAVINPKEFGVKPLNGIMPLRLKKIRRAD